MEISKLETTTLRSVFQIRQTTFLYVLWFDVGWVLDAK